MLVPLLMAALATDSTAGVVVRDGCSEDSAIVATVQATDRIAVHYGVAGEAVSCYSVSVTISGVEERGYILGTSLPAVEEFERRRALESRIPMPIPPVEEKKAADRTISPEEAGPLAGREFPPWSGIDWNRKPVAIRPGDAKLTLVAFLRPQVKAARFQAVDVSWIANKFSKQGVRGVGLIEGASLFDTRTYLEELDVTIPLASDRSSLAKEFGADPSKGTVLILDSSSKVIASSTDPKKIQAILTKLLAP